jgi:hypothetical protein
MGLTITLINCNGEVLETVTDPQNILHRLLPSGDDGSGDMLDKIDWYGDTYFNYLQMKRFIAEWDHLLERTGTKEERALVEAIKKLAVRSLNERDVLRFIGD